MSGKASPPATPLRVSTPGAEGAQGKLLTTGGVMIAGLVVVSVLIGLSVALFTVLGTTIWRSPPNPQDRLPSSSTDNGGRPNSNTEGMIFPTVDDFPACSACSTSVAGLYGFRSVAPATVATLIVDFQTGAATLFDSAGKPASGVIDPATGSVLVVVPPNADRFTGTVTIGTANSAPTFALRSPEGGGYAFEFATLVGNGPWAEAAMVSQCASAAYPMTDFNAFYQGNTERCLNVAAASRVGELAFRDENTVDATHAVTCAVSLDTGRVVVTVYEGVPPFMHGVPPLPGGGGGAAPLVVTDRVALEGTLNTDYTFNLNSCSTPTVGGAPVELVGLAAAGGARGFLDVVNGLAVVESEGLQYVLYPMDAAQIMALTVWP